MVIIVLRVVCLCVIVFHSTVAGYVALHLSWKVKGQQPNILLPYWQWDSMDWPWGEHVHPRTLSLPGTSCLHFCFGVGEKDKEDEGSGHRTNDPLQLQCRVHFPYKGTAWCTHWLINSRLLRTRDRRLALAAVHPDVRIWAWVYPSSLLQDFWWVEF